MTEYLSDVASGLMNDGERAYVPGVNCSTCGRFVGRDGWLEFEFFEMSSALASVSGECARCVAAAVAREQVDEIPALPMHRTEAGYPRCATCDGGGCPDCTDPA